MSSLNINELFGGQSVDFECPDCNHKFKIKSESLLKANSIVKCPGCQKSIRIEHDSKTNKSLKDADKALKDFEKSLKNIFK